MEVSRGNLWAQRDAQCPSRTVKLCQERVHIRYRIRRCGEVGDADFRRRVDTQGEAQEHVNRDDHQTTRLDSWLGIRRRPKIGNGTAKCDQ